jgi:hypothetical protein
MYHNWLQQDEDFSIKKTSQPTSSSKLGQPEKKFEKLSERGKYRVIANQLQSSRSSPIMFMQAAESSARREGQFDLARNLKTFRISTEKNRESFAKIKPEKALSLLLSKNLSVDQYKAVQELGSEHGYDIFPSLYSMRKIKNECRPDNISYTELKCNVPLQKLLDHSSKRVIKIFESDLIKEMEDKNISIVKLKLISNIGFDGTSHQTNYNQKFESNDIPSSRDSNLFVTTLTPLSMASQDVQAGWINEHPHSPLSVRPKTLEFIKVSLIFLLNIFNFFLLTNF